MKIRNAWLKMASVFILLVSWADQSYAVVDSYRYLHVTVQTPWSIFLFLLAGILAPFLLMGVLVWRFAGRKSTGEETSTLGGKEE